MTARKTILIISIALFSSCDHSTKHSNKRKVVTSIDSNSKVTASIDSSSRVDTSNSQLYDYIKIVFSQQRLDSSFGFDREPLSYFPDSAFLTTLLIKHPKKKVRKKPDNGIMIFTGEFDECLTREDIDFMLAQKNRHEGFKWDARRINLIPAHNLEFGGREYSFSIPVFSKDGKKFLIQYDSYAQGGYSMLFIKEDDKWIAQEGGRWIH